MKMNNNNKKNKKSIFLIAILALTVMVGTGAASFAYLTDSTAAIVNYFSKGIKYTLSYHSNVVGEDIEVPEDQVSVNEGKFRISSMKPVRKDFVFTSWNTEPDGLGTVVNLNQNYTTSQLHTDLYAQWTTGYTLIYDANGGTNAPAPQTQVSSADSHTFTIQNKGNMQGENQYKVFLGWSEDPKAKEPTYGYNGKYGYTGPNFDGDNTQTIEKNITLPYTNRTKTLYAVWATHYKLIFSANPSLNGQGKVPPTQEKISIKESFEFQIPENPGNSNPNITPTRKDASKGYYFGWWAEEEDNYNEHEGYQYGEPVTVYQTPKKDGHQDPWKVIYAIYKPPTTIGITYDANGGSGAPTTYWASVLVDDENQPKKIQKVMVESVIKPTRNYFVFLGWSKDKSKTEFNADGVTDFNPGDEIDINIYEDAKPTLYAIWRPKHRFRVRFNLNGGTTGYYIRQSDKRWTTSTGMYYESGYLNDENEIVTSYTWDKDFFNENGVFAVKNQDESGVYKFLGWSLKQNPTVNDVDFPVNAPVDPRNPTEEEGRILSDITFTVDPSACRKDWYHDHELTVYAVWEKTPLHTYKLIFTPNINPDNFNKLSDEKIINLVDRKTLNTGVSGKTTDVRGNTVNSPSGDMYSSETKPVGESLYAEWDAQHWQNNAVIPAATKNETDTERYEFRGWSFTPNSKTVDIAIDANGRINETIRIDEPSNPPSDCEGTQHYLFLFPVFEKIPQHVYNIYFDRNNPNMNGLTTTYYWKEGDAWKSSTSTSYYSNVTDVNGTEKLSGYARSYSSGRVPSSQESWTWPAASTNVNGMYLTCKDANNTTDLKFRGWSYTKYELGKAPANIEFPVTVPVDPSNPTGTEGLITTPITISEPADGSGQECTDEQGKVHNRVLYAVWDGEPMHQYQLIFSGNDEEGTNIYYKNSNGSWTYTGGSTVREVTDVHGNVETDILRAWSGTYSPAFKISDTTSASYTWTPEQWQSIGVYATKNSTDTTRYDFLGWSFDRNATDADEGLKANFVREGNYDRSYITSPITLNDPDYAHCVDNPEKIHKDVLYAIWKPVPIHTFRVTFDLNGGTYLRKANGSTTSKYSYDYPNEGFVPVSDTGSSYTFDNAYWKDTVQGLYATRNSTGKYDYEFKGWAWSKTATTPDFLVEDGVIVANIQINCNDENVTCEGGKHEKILYAVWDPKPKTKSYTLKFDYNTAVGEEDRASGKPDDIVQYETISGDSWVNKSTFDIPNQIPTYKNMAFVGWATSKTAMPGTHGPENPDTAELKTITANLQHQYEMSASGDSNATVTMYAIWAYEYDLSYYANDPDGQHAPSMEHEYTNSPEHIYTISKNYPTRPGYKFLGWSEDPGATSPTYSPFDDEYPSNIYVTADPSGKTSIQLYAVWQAE